MSPRRSYLRSGLVPALLLAGGCADLDVANPNEADRERVLNSFEDASALVGGSLNTWFHAVFDYGGPGLFMSQVPFQHASPWACATEQYSRIPRMAFQNDPANNYYDALVRPWVRSYRAIVAASDGLRSLEDPEVVAQASPEEVALVRAFGSFSLGVSHGTLALFYDQGVRMDPAVDPEAPGEMLPYGALMEVALGYLDEAVRVASGTNFTLPYGWMQAEVTAPDLVRIARSLKARFRAQVARTPEERAAVDWSAVIADVEAGIQEDFLMEMDWDAGWYNAILDYSTWPSWSGLAYFVHGMADQSGAVAEWVALPMAEKQPFLPDGRPVLIVTPDLRYPQGATVEAQRAAPGRYFRIMPEEEEGNTWKRPDRGTWRWSWYKPGPRGLEYGMDGVFDQPLITRAEMRLLKAEGLYRLGDRAGAATLVNVSRTAAGLDPTDASGANGSCVPRLHDGACGDLWEMLKWEKRLETVWTGIAGANWWFDGRGWGEFWLDTPLQFPVPCDELQVMGETFCYTFGGRGGDMGSPGSVYDYPGEEHMGWVGGPQPGSGVDLPAWCDGPPIR